MKGLLVLLRTLGDVVLVNTLAHNIKLKYPDIVLTVAVNREYKDILDGNPAISDIICPKSWDDCLYEMSCNGYQKVFCAYQTTREDNIWHSVDKYRHQHLLDFYAARCGVELKERRLMVFPQREDGDPLPVANTIAVHTTTLVPSKNWVGIGELVCRLRAKGHRIVQLGMDGDGQVEADEDLRGKLQLRQTIGYLSKCRGFIGMDSGLSYVAAAVGIPTFVIQGPTIPMTSGPFGSNVVNLVSETRQECVEVRCHGNCKYADQEPYGSCINRLQTNTVEAEVERLLCGVS